MPHFLPLVDWLQKLQFGRSTHRVDDEEVLVELLLVICELLASHVLLPHVERLPHAELVKDLDLKNDKMTAVLSLKHRSRIQTEGAYLDETLEVGVLLLPPLERNELRLVVIAHARHSLLADRAVVSLVRVLVVRYSTKLTKAQKHKTVLRMRLLVIHSYFKL